MKSAEIRRRFLEYFESRQHTIVPSSPLVPGNDPTLLFTNAGMVQFKDLFTGRETRSYTRAASSQRCVRAGGKHNDLENVGYTARHLTLFEMLGNFSFGDYFKREAIRFGWEFVTGELGLPPERLWVTVHVSDDEAERIWIEEIGVPAERVTRLDEDNFWAMGDTGPCGPCSEIFYDHGPEVWGGPPGTPEEDGDRYVEIWNLVFMQYERAADGTMTELPSPSVDTGMGLERISAVLQGVHSVYEIDLFVTMLDAVARAVGTEDRQAASLRVIADHIRSAAFLVIDGVLPGNEGRGYVLRRIIRRALRHGYKLGCTDPFFHSLVEPLANEMGEAYPELVRRSDHVRRVLLMEEEQFARTLSDGMGVLESAIAELDGDVIPGEVAFRLYDTYGFPVDLTADIARERELQVDQAGFEREMDAQRERARAASRFGVEGTEALEIDASTSFVGYERLEDGCEVVALFQREGDELRPVDALVAGESGGVILDRSPFYAEAGGQVGDTGELVGSEVRFDVADTRTAGTARLHIGHLATGDLAVGQRMNARVDAERRRCTALNHSATHLLHAALRNVLGDHVEQKGSLVAPDRLRFDFAHYQAVTAAELDAVERQVNEQIWSNSDVQTEVMGFEAARERGAMALFGEKYGDEVRVLSMGGDYSVELCGGTHVSRTGDIGMMRIVAEQAVASGVRRIEAVTGPGAMRWVRESDSLLDEISLALKSSREEAADRARALLEQQRSLEKKLAALESKLASAQGSELADQAVEVAGVRVLATQLDGVDPKGLPGMLDQLRSRIEPGVIALGTVHEGKVALIVGVSAGLTDRIQAGAVVNHIGEQTGARGGGRPDMARAGGGDRPDALPAALQSVAEFVQSQLA